MAVEQAANAVKDAGTGVLRTAWNVATSKTTWVLGIGAVVACMVAAPAAAATAFASTKAAVAQGAPVLKSKIAGLFGGAGGVAPVAPPVTPIAPPADPASLLSNVPKS